MEILAGKKTFVIAGLMFVAGGLKAIGYIDEGTYQMIMSALLPGGLIALRMGMSK